MKRVWPLVAALGVAAAAGAVTADEIAAKASAAWVADYESIQDYRCAFVSVQLNGEGDEEQRSEGFDYFKKPDRNGKEVTALYVKGEKRDPAKSDVKTESYGMNVPLDDEYLHDYAFEVAGSATVAGKPCHILKFTSEGKGGDYIHGRIWVEADTYKIAAMEAAYNENPKHITALTVKMWFADFGGHRMLQKFTASGHYRAYLVFTGDFTVNETYDDYRFNVGVTDAQVK